MKKYLLTILLASVSSVLFAQWTTPTTGTTTTNDKIGIGTTSPVSKVEVVGNMGSTPILKLFNTDNVDGRSSILFQSNKPSLQGWEFGENVGGGINNFGLRDITASGSPIRFVVNTNGYFGIGTSNPSSTLDVAGNTTLGVAQKDVTIQFRGYNGAYSQIYSNSGASINYNGLTLSNNTSGANSLPSWTLDIGGADNVNFQNSDTYSIRRMNAEVFRINSAGNIGIGTSNPTAKLDVAGNTTLGVAQKDVTIQFRGYNGAYSQIYSNSGASLNYNGLTLSNNTSGANSLPSWTLDIGGADNINFQNSDTYSIRRMNAEVFRINSSGNVLIGKISQSNSAYKLDVAGSVRANAINVNTTGADFVFENDYKLRPLSEVESFVKANHHLPEIPSADQMQEKGMDVGELNKRLLQKVEELTLYLIEKDKKDKALEAKVSKLTSEIIRLKKSKN